MPVHGDAPEEVLELVTRAGGSWWLAIAENRPAADSDVVELAAIPALEVPRTSAAWALPAAGQVQHATGVTMPAATSATTAGAWVLFDDAGLTLPRWSRWLGNPTDPAAVVAAGKMLYLPPEVLALEFTPAVFTL